MTDEVLKKNTDERLSCGHMMQKHHIKMSDKCTDGGFSDVASADNKVKDALFAEWWKNISRALTRLTRYVPCSQNMPVGVR